MSRFELETFSLPRKRSTPELHRQKIWARDRVRTGDHQLGRLTLYQLSYSRLKLSGESRIRTCEVKNSRFTVCPRWPLEYLPNILKNLKSRWRDSNPRPADYKSAALASWATSAFSIFNGSQMYRFIFFQSKEN